jgi:lipopolysaccharide biosynthesis regulator YciM
VGKLHPEKQALHLWQNLLKRQPENVHANYHLGKILLEQADQAGVAPMEKAIAADYRYAVTGCELLLKFYQQLEQHDRASYYLQQYQQQRQLYKTAIKSRAEIKAEDQFLPHQLSDFMQRQLREHLELYPEIAKAYLVRKKPSVLPEQPLYVLVLVRRIVRSPRNQDIDPQMSFDRYDRLVQISNKRSISPTNSTS